MQVTSQLLIFNSPDLIQKISIPPQEYPQLGKEAEEKLVLAQLLTFLLFPGIVFTIGDLVSEAQ